MKNDLLFIERIELESWANGNVWGKVWDIVRYLEAV